MVFAGGRVYVTGGFDAVNGAPRAYAAALDATHHHTLHILTARQQSLGGNERRSAHHLRVGSDLKQGLRHIGQRLAIAGINLDVRDHAQHAIAYFLLKAIHHAEHNDQRCHAQSDAQHGHAGDKRDKAVAPRGTPGPGVAQAD